VRKETLTFQLENSEGRFVIHQNMFHP